MTSPNNTTPCDFSLEHYVDILGQARAAGYEFPLFREYALDPRRRNRVLLLRHDIDISLAAALTMAQVERQLNVRSAYFVRLYSRFYNPLAVENLPSLLQIRNQGFEIGLHYDARVYEKLGVDATEMVKREKLALETMLGTLLFGLSEHMPTRRGRDFVNGNHMFDAITLTNSGFLYEAYTRDFVQDAKYISDSNRHWREGCLCQWIGRRDKLYALIHPYWWSPGSAERKQEIIEQLRLGY